MCVFVLHAVPSSGVGGERRGASPTTTTRDGVAAWTTVPVAEAEALHVAKDEEQEEGNGVFGEEEEVVKATPATYSLNLPGLSRVTEDRVVVVGATARRVSESSDSLGSGSNLYWPMYFGDAHIKVGQPFAITCILSAVEPVNWQRDGVVISGRRGGIVAPQWRVRRQTRAAAAEEDVNRVKQEQEKATGEVEMELEPVDMRWIKALESVLQGNNNNVTGNASEMELLWRDLMLFSSSAGDAGDGTGDGDGVGRLILAGSQRQRRNVSDVEQQFKLRQYYNALVAYMNQPGSGGYFLDGFLKREPKEEMELEMEGIVKEQDEGEHEEDMESEFVFTEGQG